VSECAASADELRNRTTIRIEPRSTRIHDAFGTSARRLHAGRAAPDRAAAHAAAGAGLSQPSPLQYRAAAWSGDAAGLPGGRPPPHRPLPGSGAVRRLRAGAAWLSAAADEPQVARSARPRHLRLSAGQALGLGGALARSRPARAQAAV